jgi:hypothetical protein
MNDDDRLSNQSKFWLGANLIVCTAVVCIIWVISSYYKDLNAQVASMVNAGADPIAVSCALQDSYGNNPVCVVIASKKVK